MVRAIMANSIDPSFNPLTASLVTTESFDMSAIPKTQSQSDLAAFSKKIAALGMQPLWERTARMVPGTSCKPFAWRYAETRPYLQQASGLISKSDAERRVLMLENPTLRGTTFSTPTLFAGLQIILPGEIARSHRHSPAALRFILEGEGAYTAVGGERVSMSPGDFVVTPSWAWHDHGNLGDQPVIWLDGLDTPFAALFGAMFREDHPQATQPIERFEEVSDADFDPRLLPDYRSKPSTALLPTIPQLNYPLLRYPYTRTREALRALAATSAPHPAHGYKLRYAHPGTGGYPFPTMAVFMQWLPRGFTGARYRATDSSVLVIAEGRCEIELDGQKLALAHNDVLALPAWESYRLCANEDAVIFSYSDRAAQEALGLWREATGEV